MGVRARLAAVRPPLRWDSSEIFTAFWTREFRRKFFLLIPLSTGKETEKACLNRLLPILRWIQRPYPSYQHLYRD